MFISLSRLCSSLKAICIFLGALPVLFAVAPSTPPFRIGLNGVFIGNSSLTTEQQLALFEEVGCVGLRHFNPNDVGWSSVQYPNGLFKFTDADAVLASAHPFGYLPTFYGADALNYYVPPGTASTNAWSASSYGTQTTTYLQTVVNRYKAKIKYWEIANEMNTKTTPPAGFTAAGYAAFLLYNRNAIRAADPEAQVVIAGLLGNYGYPMANAYSWLQDVLTAGGGAGFDVFNYHDYKSWWTLTTHFDQFRAILDTNGLQTMPIWVSETAQASRISTSNVNPAYASVDGQAADVWRRPCLLFGKGVQTVFWHSFWSNSADPSGFHDMGLVDATSGIRKKAWYSFRLLNQKVEGFSATSLVSVGTATDDNVTGGAGVWVVRFDFADGTRRWVAWSPNNQTATLAGLTGVSGLALTTVVPSVLSSDGLTATWTSSSMTVSGDSASITLADSPVLIEVVPRFTVWQQAHFSVTELTDSSVSGDTADPDSDGLANLIEYALGSDPRVASSGSSPSVGTDLGATDALPHLIFTLQLDAGATDITSLVEVSGDLQTWQSGSGNTEVVSDTTSANVRTLVIRDKTALDTTSRRFIRLKVTHP
ncbi:MAG: hypothetical protein RIQ79_1264 [Verrucomicrobiota bacterium]